MWGNLESYKAGNNTDPNKAEAGGFKATMRKCEEMVVWDPKWQKEVEVLEGRQTWENQEKEKEYKLKKKQYHEECRVWHQELANEMWKTELLHWSNDLKEPEKSNFIRVMNTYWWHIQTCINKYSHLLKWKGPDNLLAFIKGVIDHESSFKENTTDWKWSYGLMQIRMGSTVREIINITWIDPSTSSRNNLEWWIAYLFWLIWEFWLEKWLSAYNAWPTKYRKWEWQITKYAHWVLNDMKKYI